MNFKSNLLLSLAPLTPLSLSKAGLIDGSILSAALGSNVVNQMKIGIETVIGAGGLFLIVSGLW